MLLQIKKAISCRFNNEQIIYILSYQQASRLSMIREATPLKFHNIYLESVGNMQVVYEFFMKIDKVTTNKDKT